MADIVASTSQDQNRQLDELKQDYDRRMQKLRDEQRTKEAEIRSAGEAAVSHLKRSTDERVQNVEKQVSDHAKADIEAINDDYSKLRTRALREKDIAERELDTTRTKARQNVETVKSEAEREIAAAQTTTRAYKDAQDRARKEIAQQVSNEITDIKKQGSEKVHRTKEELQVEEQALMSKDNQAIENERLREKNQLARTHLTALEQLNEEKNNDNNRLAQQKQLARQNFDATRNQVHESIAKTQRAAEQKITALEKAAQHELEERRARMARTNEKVQKSYTNEIQRVQTEGNQQIAYEQEKDKALLKEEKLNGQAEVAQVHDEWAAKRDQEKNEYQTRIAELGKKYEETLTQQRGGFQSRYDATSKAQKSAFDHQRETYMREIYRQQKALEEKSQKIVSRGEDPFYRMRSFDASIEDHDSHYILRAKVPPAELNDLRIAVKEDKVTLSSKRKFQDGFSDGISRSETNAFESYRQEFDLPMTADAKRIVKGIKDDGTITVIIPKKGVGVEIA